MKEKEKIKNKMKDMIKKVKLSKSQIMTIVLAVVFSVSMSLGTSYAATTIFSSSDVGFDNTGTKIQATTVQGAIDELYDAATDYSGINTRVNGLEETIGDSTLTTTDQTLTGGINELNTNFNSLSDSLGNFGNIYSGSFLSGSGSAVEANVSKKILSVTVPESGDYIIITGVGAISAGNTVGVTIYIGDSPFVADWIENRRVLVRAASLTSGQVVSVGVKGTSSWTYYADARNSWLQLIRIS